MKNKLEEIKAQYHLLKRNDYDLGAWDEPFSWLIEQAERVQELESESSKYEARINNLTFDLAVSRVQNKRYREALIKVKLGSESDVIHYSTRLKSINKIAVEALEDES